MDVRSRPEPSTFIPVASALPGRMKTLVQLFLLPSIVLSHSHSIHESDSHAINADLNGQKKVSLEWQTNFQDKSIDFTLHADLASSKWWLLGFSDHGKYARSDYCKLVVEDGTPIDGFLDSKLRMVRDRQQDCHLLQVNTTSFSFRREWTTCDPKDYALETGTAQMILARSSARTSNFSDKAVSKLIIFALLLEDPPTSTRPTDENQVSFFVGADAIKVPSSVTTYHCVVKRLPEVVKHKHHLIWVANNISAGNEFLVHHAVLFHCPTGLQEINYSLSFFIPHFGLQEFSGDCNDPKKPKAATACSKVLAAIAMGEGPTVYPPNAGLPMGGDNYNPYVMVEIHYNNVAQRADIIDSSGFEVILTPSLREHDAGIMEIGVIYGDANSIPPGQEAFGMTGFCTADCSNHSGKKHEVDQLKANMPDICKKS